MDTRQTTTTDRQHRTKMFDIAKVARVLGAKKVPYRKRHREITTFFRISAPLISIFFIPLIVIFGRNWHQKINFFFEKKVAQGAAGVLKTHNLANVSFKVQSNRIPRIKYFGACIPPMQHLADFLGPQKQAKRHITHFQWHQNPWRKIFARL